MAKPFLAKLTLAALMATAIGSGAFAQEATGDDAVAEALQRITEAAEAAQAEADAVAEEVEAATEEAATEEVPTAEATDVVSPTEGDDADPGTVQATDVQAEEATPVADEAVEEPVAEEAAGEESADEPAAEEPAAEEPAAEEAAGEEAAAEEEAAPAEEAEAVAFGPDPLEGLPIIGVPVEGGMGWQPAATSLAEDIHWLDTMLLWIIGAIVLFVTILLAIVVVRYNAKANKEPATFTHNSPLEVAWTIVPIVILVFIGAFSLPVLFNQQEIPEGDVRIKVTGYQWYWGYEYPDEEISFESFMIGYGEGNFSADIEAQLVEAGYSADEFLLATDTSVVVPVGATVVMDVTGADVIHSWTIPAFGVKQDAVPGRIAQLWFEAEQEGIYFGQCSELCGKDHAYMPITVKVVSEEAYAEWLNQVRGNADYRMW